MLESAAFGYGRRQTDPGLSGQDQAIQARTLITCTENRFTNPINLIDDYSAPLSCESRSYQLTGLTPDASGRFEFFTVDDAVTRAAPLAYEATPSGGLQKRLIEHVRTLYRKDDLSGPLPLAQLASLRLPFETYRLAFTPGLVTQVYGSRVTGAMLTNEGRYVRSEGDKNWWVPSGRVFYSPNTDDTPAQELDHARRHFFLSRRFRDPFGQMTSVRHDDHDLLLLESEDPLHNKVTAGERDQQGNVTNKNDYRVLQPSLLTDPNGNRSALAFDALGLAVGTATSGKAGQNAGDSLDGFEPDLDEGALIAHVDNPSDDPHGILGRATTRLLYDMHRYGRTSGTANPQPSVVCTLARETHDADLAAGEKSKIQHSFTYSDGFGREIQQKIQAEPGDVDGIPTNPRWVGGGWTLFNNKGKPVKRYEPFFSATHLFELELSGVASTLFYDPLERVVATLHPNHAYEKLVFDPWRQETWDANDTVLLSDPKTDPHVGDFFGRLPTTDYLPTWHEGRKSGQRGDAEKTAATKAAAHAGTPTVACFDTLGRPFLTIADNGIKGKYQTRVELDIEGNQRAVIDARGRTVARYDYDMLGNRIKRSSMEAGARWTLANAAGKPIFAWDSRSHTVRTTYDALRRPAETFLRKGAGAELLVGRTIYGESQGSSLNHRGRVYRQFDGAGLLTSEAYDFKGNLLRSGRRLAADYKDTLNWLVAVPLEARTFTSSTTYDALNRPITLVSPDNSVVRPSYNEANLLERIVAYLRGAAAATTFVKGIDYNAKGQRERIELGNSSLTEYAYDEDTFRLVRLETTRPAFPAAERVVQDLRYTYDPVGNITRIEDDAQDAIFFKNQRVEPSADYTYDAVYRLIEATGREHLGQTAGGALRPPVPTSQTDAPRVGLAHPGDGNAMGGYTEKYEYDQAGNIAKIIHAAISGNWTRSYAYEEPSQLEPTQQNNRLTSTKIGTTTGTYVHDAHGNMTVMPHLPLMLWDYRDRLQATAQQVIKDGTPETTYYVHDAADQRVRKVTERPVTAQQATTGKKPTRSAERVYVGGFEIYRQYGTDGTTVTLEREALHIMDDAQRVALVETRTRGDDGSPGRLVRYQFGNHLGSANLELDYQGQIISYEEYTPYGSTSYQAVRSQTEAAKRYHYTGKERDGESGLYYHGARHYAPWIGRWTSSDPLGTGEGTNLFVYADNSPILHVDPNGRASKKVSDLIAPSIPKEPKLNDLWPYNKKVPNVKKLGKNVQREHPIPVALRKEQRTAPNKTQHHNRKVSAAKGQPTILLETGKATATEPAKPHTQIKKTQMEVLEDFRAGRLKSESDLVGRIQEGYKEVNQSLRAQGKPEIKKLTIDTAILGDQATVHVTTVETAKELKALGSTADIAKDVDKAVEGVDSAFGAMEKGGRGAKALKSLGKAGRHLAAAVPLLGIAAGQASAATAASRGDYVGAAMDEAGFIPVAGDLLDAARGGYALGEAANDLLVNEDLAMRHGDVAKAAAQKLGAGETMSDVVGGLAAAGSAVGQVLVKATPLGFLLR